jgi:hypothetical protein
MKPIAPTLALFAFVVASSAAADPYRPIWTSRGSSSSVSTYASFGRFSISTTSHEYVRTSTPNASSSLRPRASVEVAPNDCGPRAFQVVNARQAEAPCVGDTARR